MRSLTRPTVGVEPFDTGYGGGFQVQVDSPDAMACELVEDGGEFRRHVPAAAERPRRLAFVDGTMRVEARLTRTDVQGTVTGLAGSWGAGAVLADGARLLRFDRITIGRAAIFSAGQRVELPPQPGGWRWEADSITGTEPDAGSERLRRRMRDTEAGIAEGLAEQDWLAVIDGPLHNIRRTRTLPVIGYVKTHHRPMLGPEAWRQVPDLHTGERSGLFAMRDDLYGCYLRVGMPGPWAGPWAGIVRLEVPAGVGLARGQGNSGGRGRLAARVRLRPPPRPPRAGQHGPGRRPGTPPPPPAGRPAPGAARRTRRGTATQPPNTISKSHRQVHPTRAPRDQLRNPMFHILCRCTRPHLRPRTTLRRYVLYFP